MLKSSVLLTLQALHHLFLLHIGRQREIVAGEIQAVLPLLILRGERGPRILRHPHLRFVVVLLMLRGHRLQLLLSVPDLRLEASNLLLVGLLAFLQFEPEAGKLLHGPLHLRFVLLQQGVR